jgi:hypothetical protein
MELAKLLQMEQDRGLRSCSTLPSLPMKNPHPSS